MSTIRTNEVRINNPHSGRAIPEKDYDIEDAIKVSRYFAGVLTTLIQYDYSSDSNYEVLFGKDVENEYPIIPIKEIVSIHPIKLKNYIGFSCDHYKLNARVPEKIFIFH